MATDFEAYVEQDDFVQDEIDFEDDLLFDDDGYEDIYDSAYEREIEALWRE